jgi:hypothetical protein
MADIKRLLSTVLLALGVLLVLLGLVSALGFTPGGIIASIAAIGALLYVGGIWFAQPAPADPARASHPLIVFNRDRVLVSGAGIGQSVLAHFPEPARAEVERRCAAALAGISSRFPCSYEGRTVTFDALPVRSADGEVVYGILVVTDALPAAIAVSA